MAGSMELSTTIPPVRKKGGKRAALLVVGMVIAITAVYLSPVRAWLHDPAQVRRAVQSLGIWIYPSGILSIAFLVGCGVPRLLLCTVAGMMLGFWGGLLLGEVGTILGYYAVFLFIRWGGSSWALHRWPKLGKWSELVAGQGIVGVILLRQMPIHGTVTNLGLGLSRIRQRDFLIGTAIGLIPESIPATLVGTGLVKGSPKTIATFLALAAVIFAVIWIACGYAFKALRKTPSGTALLADEAVLTNVDQTP